DARIVAGDLGPASGVASLLPDIAAWAGVSSADCCETGRCAPATFGVRAAPADDEPRSGSNKSERESTSVRSTNYGSGHLIRVFRDIGRIFSLLFLLSHPSPIGHLLRERVQTRKRNMVSSKAKNGFNRVSFETRRLSALRRAPRDGRDGIRFTGWRPHRQGQ